MRTRNVQHLWKTPALSLAVLSTLGVPLAHAVVTPRTWDGSTSGNQDWNTAANWSNDNVPDTDGTNGESATISDTLTADRTVLIPSLKVETLTWSSNTTTGGTYVDTLKLTGNGSIRGAAALTINNEGTAAQKVLDLNGFDLNMGPSQQLTLGSGTVTIRNSGSGGGVITARDHAGSAIVESGVTLRVGVGPQTTSLGGLTMEDGSVFNVATGGEAFHMNFGATGGFWDLVVDSGAAWHGNSTVVRNDVVINGGAIGFRYAIRSLLVGGDFTDFVTSGDYSYADTTHRGTVVFDGGASTVRNVSIARTGITKVGFQVGSATTDGNIKLGNNLSTGDLFTVTNGSTADVEAFTVNAATVNIDAGSILGYTFADADTGLITASGLNGLTLNAFTLNLDLGGTWTNGNDLLLMTYSGTLNGTPSMNLGNVPDGFSYDSFETSGGQVRLTNVAVAVPEPSAALAAAGMLTLLGLARRRRVRQPIGIMD